MPDDQTLTLVEQHGGLTITVTIDEDRENNDLLWRPSGKGWEASLRPMRSVTVTVHDDERVIHHDRCLIEAHGITANALKTIALHAAFHFTPRPSRTP